MQDNVREKRIVVDPAPSVDPAQAAAEVNQAIAACNTACTRNYVLQLSLLGRFRPTSSTLAFFYRSRLGFLSSSARRCHLNCQSGCCSVIIIMLVGSYIVTETFYYTDINQCISGVTDCVPTLSTCEPTLGGFSCRCNDGFSGDGRTGMGASGCQGLP